MYAAGAPSISRIKAVYKRDQERKNMTGQRLMCHGASFCPGTAACQPRTAALAGTSCAPPNATGPAWKAPDANSAPNSTLQDMDSRLSKDRIERGNRGIEEHGRHTSAYAVGSTSSDLKRILLSKARCARTSIRTAVPELQPRALRYALRQVSSAVVVGRRSEEHDGLDLDRLGHVKLAEHIHRTVCWWGQQLSSSCRPKPLQEHGCTGKSFSEEVASGTRTVDLHSMYLCCSSGLIQHW